MRLTGLNGLVFRRAARLDGSRSQTAHTHTRTHGRGKQANSSVGDRFPLCPPSSNEAQDFGEGRELTPDRVVVRGTGESRPGRVKVRARARLFVLVLDKLRLFDNLVPRRVLRQALQFRKIPQPVPLPPHAARRSALAHCHQFESRSFPLRETYAMNRFRCPVAARFGFA